MSRYWGVVVIEFLDGEIREVGGNRAKVDEDKQLAVYEECDYGLISKMNRFPLSAIKSWRWKDGQP